jgi:UDP-2-acetamido-3-amino-2,3-dideoxy-glucuronate N-acetyltransferase
MSASDTPAIAIIGCGQWGRNHVRTWSEIVDRVYVYDEDPQRVGTMIESFRNVRSCSSFDEVLESPDIGALVIATPAVTHARLVLAALKSGKYVLVEKPMAVDLTDASDLIAEASKASRILMVGHVLEYHPAFRRLCELVEDGTLGRTYYAYSHRLNFGRVRTEENALWSFAPHDIALLLRLLGRPPREVSCRGGSYLGQDVADVSLMSMNFGENVHAHIFVSWLHPFKEQRFVVVGERQMAVFDDTLPWESKLLLYPHTVNWVGGRVPVATSAEARAVELSDHTEPLRAECEAFLDSVRTRVPPLTSGQSGAAVLAVLDAGERSLRAGGAGVRLTSESSEGSHRSNAPMIHDTALIDRDVLIGDGSRVWHFSHVMPRARIGSNCSIGQNVYIASDVTIGNRVKIQNNVSVYEGVTLEDDVFCGPSAVFTNVRNPRAAIERKSEYRPTRIRRGATLGANCTIVCGVTVGEYALIGAGAVVTTDIPRHALVVGVPARVAGWVCSCGVTLIQDGLTWECSSCGHRYSETSSGLSALSGGDSPLGR